MNWLLSVQKQHLTLLIACSPSLGGCSDQNARQRHEGCLARVSMLLPAKSAAIKLGWLSIKLACSFRQVNELQRSLQSATEQMLAQDAMPAEKPPSTHEGEQQALLPVNHQAAYATCKCARAHTVSIVKWALLWCQYVRHKAQVFQKVTE